MYIFSMKIARILFPIFLLFFLISFRLAYANQNDPCDPSKVGPNYCGTGSGTAGDCAKGEECWLNVGMGGSNWICRVNLSKCPVAARTDTSGQCCAGGQCPCTTKCISNACTLDISCAVPSPVPSGSHPDYTYTGIIFTDLNQLLTPAAKIIYYAALLVGFLFIILAGYKLMTSEGNPQRVQEGQEQLTAAILGIIFILLSAAILRVIINNIIGGNVSFK